MENKTFNSGLYNGLYNALTFYNKQMLDLDEDCGYVEYNKHLLIKVWTEQERLEGTEAEIESNVINLFWDRLDIWDIYYKPMIFNEEIALECGLVPFLYRGTRMLALAGACDMFMSPKLDAYQVLTQGTIDKDSSFFTNKDGFEHIVGKAIIDKVDAILKREG